MFKSSPRINNGELSEMKRVEDIVEFEAESELLDAKKTVKELEKMVEESNSRIKAQFHDLEKENKLNREDKDFDDTKLMKELEIAKQDLCKLKEDMATILEEKRRAENERETYNVKAESYSNFIEELTEKIEDLNEELVLVELARLEVAKEREANEAQWKETTNQYSTKLHQTKKKINDRNRKIERIINLETRLAATTDDANMLESELKLVKEMDKYIPQNEKESESSLILESLTEELEAEKLILSSIKAEGFNLMSAMDIIRKELNMIMAETSHLKRKEARTDLNIQNLNSKLLRAQAKLEGASASEEKVQSTILNLSIAITKLKLEAEAAEKERLNTIEETKNIKAEVTKTESDIDTAEDKLIDALQILKKVKSSEADALENLKVFTEKTMRNRAIASKRRSRSTITITTFEYEYLKGSAVRAAEIADKKVAAAKAWVNALKASEKEILMKIKENKEEKEEVKIEQLSPSKTMVERQKPEKAEKTEKYESVLTPSRQLRRSSIKFTPTGRARYHKAGSPAGRLTPRSASLHVNRRRVMPKLAKFFSGKSQEC